MAQTPSTMIALGTPLPDFTLAATDGSTVSSRDLRNHAAVLVIFMCNHCPFVKHIRDQLAAIGRDYQPKDVAIVGINANDVSKYPDDSPEKMALEAEEAGYTFPYLFDETQEVARAFDAACTPDFFLYDGSGRLVYRGQLDDSRPGNNMPVTGRDLRTAIDAVLAGRDVPAEQKPSIGCNIKWRVG